MLYIAFFFSCWYIYYIKKNCSCPKIKIKKLNSRVYLFWMHFIINLLMKYVIFWKIHNKNEFIWIFHEKFIYDHNFDSTLIRDLCPNKISPIIMKEIINDEEISHQNSLNRNTFNERRRNETKNDEKSNVYYNITYKVI